MRRLKRETILKHMEFLPTSVNDLDVVYKGKKIGEINCGNTEFTGVTNSGVKFKGIKREVIIFGMLRAEKDIEVIY